MELDEVDVGVLTHQTQNGFAVNVESKQRLAEAFQHPHWATFAPGSTVPSVLFLVYLPTPSVSHSAVYVYEITPQEVPRPNSLPLRVLAPQPPKCTLAPSSLQG